MTARAADTIDGSSSKRRRRFQHLQAVYDLADSVTRATELEEVYHQAVRVVAVALAADRVALLVCDGAGVMRFRAWEGLSEGYRAATEGHSPWRAEEADPRPVVIEDASADESLGELRETVLAEGIRALAFIPLVAGERLLGKFMLYHDRPHVFGGAELRLVTTIAAGVALAIERRRMDDALRTSRDQLDAVFQSVADGITVLDRQGRFVFANEAAAGLCGFDSVSEMLATPTEAIMESFRLWDEHGAELPPGRLPARRVLAGEAESELLVRYRNRGSDEERWSTVRATPVHDGHGDVCFAVSVFRDVTEKHWEDERRCLRAQAGSIVGGSLSLRDTLERLAALFVPRFADSCAVHLSEGDGTRLGAVHHRDPSRLAAARQAATSSAFVPPGMTSTVVVVLPGPAGPLGAVTLVTEDGRPPLDEHGLALANELAAAASLPIQNARLHAAEREARRDAERAVIVLARLERVANAMLHAGSLDEVLAGLLEALRDALGSDRATMLLLEGADELVLRASVGIAEEIASAVRVPLGEGVAGRIAASEEPLVIDDLAEVEVVSPYLRGTGSLAGVPLLFGRRLLGVLHVSSDRTAAFSADDLEFLKLAGERVAVGVEQARIFERQQDIATALQRSLLPERFPRVPGIAISAMYLPAADGARVGGDWYDAFPVGDGRVLIAVGDVVGHGIDAAASMGQVRNALRAYAREDASPVRIFERLSSFVLEVSPREFCTAFCAVVDPWAGSIEYVNAGHPAPIALEPSTGVRFLDGVRSVPLGVMPNAQYEPATDSLEPGTILFGYTDGLVERRDETLDRRLAVLLGEVADAADVPLRRLPEAIASLLLADGPRPDDVAILAAQVASSAELRLRLPAEAASLAIVRRAVAGFLGRAGARPSEIFELQVACGEACANVVVHAYGTRQGFIRVHGVRTGDVVRISVRDTGRWREAGSSRARRGGHGLPLIRAFADELEIRDLPSGTDVLISRRLAAA